METIAIINIVLLVITIILYFVMGFYIFMGKSFIILNLLAVFIFLLNLGNAILLGIKGKGDNVKMWAVPLGVVGCMIVVLLYIILGNGSKRWGIGK